MSKQLPERANLEHLKKQAKDLLEALSCQEPEAIETVALYFPSQHNVGLNDAQLVIAREYGFESWAKLKDYVEAQAVSLRDRFVGITRQHLPAMDVRQHWQWQIHHHQRS